MKGDPSASDLRDLRAQQGGIPRIMRRHDFEFVGLWEARSAHRTEFVYVLAWPDEAAMRVA
jgi:hypothetical protein